MADNQLICGLRRQYALVLGLIKTGKGQSSDLEHLAAVIRMFRPDEDLAAIKPIRPYRPQRSKWLRDAFAVLRDAKRPMTARAIARAVLEGRGIPLTRVNLQRVECSLHAVLERWEGAGVTRAPGEPKRWSAG